ncbi:MAG TPA: metalloregulator ArsR/SmtB family transcription factor [Pseudomonadales bacterium]
MSAAIPVTDPLPVSELLAQLCKASGEPLRVEILRVLRSDSFSVQELCRIFDVKQSAMSHHLKVLANARLVITRREGNTLFYRRRLWPHDHALVALQQALLAAIDQCPLGQAQRHGIEAIEQQRTASSNAFFIDNAGRLREQQDLIAGFEQYADSVAAMLAGIALPAHSLAIEIGPGEGLFLPLLARRFEQVMAFDTSSAMLLQCERLLRNNRLANVRLFLGDSKVACRQQLAADCIVINMVLHHVATPAELFNDAARLLKPGGALLITDLCHHDQSWARDACGDVWLGFEPEDFSLWAQHAGLLEGQASFLAQRNGFRIQIRHFYQPEDN